jgi:arylsulfatase
MMEVYAGFSEHTDVQVGRLIDYLEQSGQLDNTIIFYCADNGASGEGSPSGSVNENKFFNNFPDELSENMKYLDVLGSTETYGHYPTGWGGRDVKAVIRNMPAAPVLRWSSPGRRSGPLAV